MILLFDVYSFLPRVFLKVKLVIVMYYLGKTVFIFFYEIVKHRIFEKNIMIICCKAHRYLLVILFICLKVNVTWCIPRNPINLLWSQYILPEISLSICISKLSWGIVTAITTMYMNTPDNFQDFQCTAG